MGELPDAIKNDNWIFFVEAKSGDPTHAIPGCKNLVENLITSAIILEAKEYEDALTRCHVWSRRAHHAYYVEHDVFAAMDWCNAITVQVTKIIYEEEQRFANARANSFKYIPEVKKNV